MRVIVTLALSFAVSSIFAGCSTTGMSWRAAMGMPPKAESTKTETASKDAGADSKSKDKDKVAATEPAKEKDKDKPAEKIAATDTKPNPFKPSREKPLETATAKPAETTAAKPVATAKTIPETTGVSWSPDIVQLIGDELRDATPEERAEWHENLKRVDPGVIPDILRARRLSRQATEIAQKPVEAPPSKVADSSTRRPSELDFDWKRDTGVLPSLENEITSGTRDAGRVQPAGFTNPSSSNRVTHATYQTAADQPQRVSYASQQVPQRTATTPTTNEGPVVLQGYVVDDGAAPPTHSLPPPQIGGTSPPKSYGATTSEPASIAWPPASNKPAVNSSNVKTANASSSLPFGSGFVQNVVSLVPNRGTTAIPATPAALPPQTLASSLPWRAELERTIAALEQEVATLKPSSSPDTQNDYLRKHVALRQLYLLTDRQERALTAIPGIDAADQEFWQQVFWGMSNYMDVQHIPRPQDRASQTISQMSTAIRRLQEQADLQIRNVAFCRQIQYFGNYERFPRDEFRPGQEVLLYAEVENFKSEPTADGQYRTLLRSTIEILSPNGELRKQIDFAGTEDLCRNYRRDYFHNYQFIIPERIPLGPHTLKLTVFDELSGRMVSYTMNFNVQ